MGKYLQSILQGLYDSVLNSILHGEHLYVSFSMSLDLVFRNAFILCDVSVYSEPGKFHSQISA